MSVHTSKGNPNDKWLTTQIAKSIAGDNSCHSPIKERDKQGILLVPWLNDDRSATRTPRTSRPTVHVVQLVASHTNPSRILSTSRYLRSKKKQN